MAAKKDALLKKYNHNNFYGVCLLNFSVSSCAAACGVTAPVGKYMFKIAFLFLTMGSIYHETHWLDFLKGNEANYSIYIHSKEPLEDSSPFKQYEIKQKEETTWLNTMRAQLVLLKEALKDPENEKFIFVSESTIPFYDFRTVYDRVIGTNKSIFPYVSNDIHLDPSRSGTFWNYHNYQPRRDMHPIPRRFQYRSTQWVILNRKHAELMANDNKYIEIISQIICDNEHYVPTVLAIKNLLHEVENDQTTYDDWIATSSPSSPYTFTNLRDEEQYKIVKKAIRGELYGSHKYLFGRKFAKDCDLTPLDGLLAYQIAWD